MTGPEELSPDDFRARLQAATTDPPALPTPADRVRQGRRAVRRRRTVQGVATVAAVAVIGTGATWVAAGGPDDRTGTDPAGQQSTADLCPVLPPMTEADAAALPTAEPAAKVRPYAANEPFAYDYTDDSFAFRPGLGGLEHLTGTLAREGHADTRWDAAAFEGTNGTWYGLATFTRNLGPGGGGGGSSRFAQVGPDGPPLAQWTALHLEVRTDSNQDVLDVDDDGSLVAEDGVEILREAEAPELEDRFGRGDTIRVAEIRRGTDTCFAVADTYDPTSTNVYLVPPEYAGGDTLEELAATVADVRESVF